MTKVSIIVPVFNVETYIEECVRSVKMQTYSEWELLLIDDGSIDGSSKICDEMSASDNRIRVVHKHNTGVSDTRNTGLDQAQGEYVIFLDADDYWYDATFLARLVKLADKWGLDIVRGEYKAVTEQGEDLFQRKISDERLKLANKVIDSATFIREAINGEFFLVLSLFRRTSIGSLRLNKEQIFLEDMRFYATLLQNSLKCMYVPAYFYAYRKNTASVSFRFNQKKLADSFGMCDFFHHCAQSTLDKRQKEFYNFYSVMMYRWTLETISLDGYYEHSKTIIDDLNLEDLRCRINRWIKEDQINVKNVVFFLKPVLGVNAFRFIGKVKEKTYSVRKRLKYKLCR